MISNELLSILCCPETKQDLVLGSIDELNAVNAKISAQQLKNRKGEEVKESVDGILIRSDRQWAYLIRQNIPIMLIDEAIPF